MELNPTKTCIVKSCNRQLSSRVKNMYGKQYYCNSHLLNDDNHNTKITIYGIDYTKQ